MKVDYINSRAWLIGILGSHASHGSTRNPLGYHIMPLILGSTVRGATANPDVDSDLR
jgi:hypothetical protein